MRNEDHVIDFDTLIDIFIEIGSHLQGEKIDPEFTYLYNAEGLGKKILNHALTVRTLFNGYTYKSFEPQIDFSSMAILTRAALETYLTLNYLFVAPKDRDELEFKLNSWYLGGLDRIKYKPAFADNLQKWQEEMLQAEELKKKIQASCFFAGLKPNRQKDVLSGDWKLGGWFELAKSAGFNEGYFRKQYMFLSSYSHSNRLSVIQIQQTKKFSEQTEMANAFIGILMVLLAKHSYDYVHIIPPLKNKVDLTSEKYQIIRIYKNIGERLSNELNTE